MDYSVFIDEKYTNTLCIEGFSSMMDSPSYSYKFFWLEAIVGLIVDGVTEATYGDIINRMIINAWYPVTEYHIHLTGYYMGEVRDNIERAVLRLEKISKLTSSASIEMISTALNEFEKDSELLKCKKDLTKKVPYKSLSGFANLGKSKIDIGSSEKIMIEYYNNINLSERVLPYTFGEGILLNRRLIFSDKWIEMIRDYAVPIIGWIKNEKLKWLQGVNPEVPGLVYKLSANDESKRKLTNVHKLWDCIMDLTEVRDVFSGNLIEKCDYDVDHFIPRSFVMNDELWNLAPMESGPNSSKNNRLPVWDVYFDKFAANQFLLYEQKQKFEGVKALFIKCYKDNLNSIWANQELYRDGNDKEEFYNILKKNMQPVYDSARRQGYKLWNR